MSPHVGNFVQDLVEMAKAMDELPKVQGELSDTRKELSAALNRVEDRELRIIDLKSQIESLQSALRTTEASRDDAVYLFLELDEKTHQVMGILIDLEGKAHGARMILDPPKPEPEPEVQQPNLDPIGSSSGGQSLPDTGQSSGQHAMAEPMPVDGWGQGQSENPLPAMEVIGSTLNANDIPVQSSENVTSIQSISANSSPYTGLYYSNVPCFISRADWLAGGGTEENYDWRP